MFCQRLVFDNPKSPYRHTVLLGIVEREEESLLWFRTAKARYTINKRLVLLIEDTDQEFVEGDYGED